MIVGKDGKPLVKVNWEEFQRCQSWDEYPEIIDNPPMTLDMTFYYNDKVFYLDAIRDGYAIFSSEWKEIIFDKNFLKLLTKPLFGGDSFKDLIEQFLFVN